MQHIHMDNYELGTLNAAHHTIVGFNKTLDDLCLEVGETTSEISAVKKSREMLLEEHTNAIQSMMANHADAANQMLREKVRTALLRYMTYTSRDKLIYSFRKWREHCLEISKNALADMHVSKINKLKEEFHEIMISEREKLRVCQRFMILSRDKLGDAFEVWKNYWKGMNLSIKHKTEIEALVTSHQEKLSSTVSYKEHHAICL